MANTSLVHDVQTFVLNAVAINNGTATATLVIPVSTTSLSSVLIFGTSAGAAGYYQDMTASVNVQSNGNTAFAAAKVGSSNPDSAITTNSACDNVFANGATKSNAVATVSNGGNLIVTVTNASNTQANDFVVVFDSYWVKNT